MLQKIENWFFKFRFWVLASFVLLTIIMGYFAVQIRMDAGFYKQLPSSHSFVKTYYEYQNDLSGTNSITVALRSTEGDIFNQNYYYENWTEKNDNKLLEFILPLENIEIIRNLSLNIENLEDINLIEKKLISKKLLFVPLNLESFLYCKKKNFEIFNFKENIDNNFHKNTLKLTKEFLEKLKFKRTLHYSLKAEIIFFLRFSY